jgi:hypothetical protein
MVDVKDMIESDYLIPSIVHDLGPNDRVGIITQVDNEKTKGNYGKTLDIVVEVQAKPKKHSLLEGGKSIKNLAAAYGTEANNWVGKRVLLSVETTKNKKDYVLLTPVEESIQ